MHFIQIIQKNSINAKNPENAHKFKKKEKCRKIQKMQKFSQNIKKKSNSGLTTQKVFFDQSSVV
jgi:hypothetical protein